MNTTAKQLPISGMVLTAAAITQQWALMVAYAVLVLITIVLIRIFWRRGKRVSDR